MSFEVGVVAHFLARHHLVGDFGPASVPHSHDYRVEAVARAEALQPDGTALNITLLQNALAQALKKLDDRDLNTLPELADPNPTAEVVARWLFERIKLPGLARVTVWESPEAYASYSPATTERR